MSNSKSSNKSTKQKTNRRPTAQGAQISSKNPIVGSYLGNHKKALLHTLSEQRRKPVASFFTCAVIGIAILLPTLLAVLLLNVHQANLNLDGSAQLTVMLKDNVTSLQATELSKKIDSVSGVSETVFIDKDKALEEFKAAFQLGETLNHLSDNPLPHSILVVLEESVATIEQAQVVKNSLEQISDVDLVQLDLMWIQRLKAISDFLSLSTWILASMLAIAVILILGNTIRLAIENRKDEIAVLKLVGGTDAFVCRPFLYLGTFYGLGGGIFALTLCWIVLSILSQPIETLISSYQSDFNLSGLNIESTILILVIGTFLGWFGANLSVKKHISEIEPN